MARPFCAGFPDDWRSRSLVILSWFPTLASALDAFPPDDLSDWYEMARDLATATQTQES